MMTLFALLFTTHGLLLAISLFVCTLVSFFLVYIVYRFCFRYNILDIPNNRSSHKKPTALMGGIGFIIAFLLGYGVMLWQQMIRFDIHFFVLLLASLFIAITSLIDDIKRLGAGKRFAVHILGASVVYFAGYKLSLFYLPFMTIDFSFINYFLTVIFIVAVTNIYNFMDGIDGYAGGIGILGSAALAAFAFIMGDYSTATILLILVASLIGFLIWNYPKAKIFMGDVGSAFLGFFFAAMIIKISQNNESSISIIPLIMIFGVFIMDASVTLIRRALNGEKVWEAHRSHFYQRLNILGWSHKKIIWLEYCHMLFCCWLSYLYIQVNPVYQLVIIFCFISSFIVKFVYITRLERLGITNGR